MTYKIRPEVKGSSELAVPVHGGFKVWPERSRHVFGVVAHTTGNCQAEADRAKTSRLEWVLGYYQDPDSYGPHYVIDLDGAIYQVSDEHEKAAHVGFGEAHRQLFLSGKWRSMLAPVTVNRWLERWSLPSPAHLFPGPSVNDVYIGVEMLPIEPDPVMGLRYTGAQHKSLAMLCADIAERWGFPMGWWNTGRLVGHEDVNPFDRSNKGGGWDPGALRKTPWFDWVWVKTEIAKREFEALVGRITG